MPVFVSAQWLHSELNNTAVKIIDASWHLPNSGRNARTEFNTLHIPGAQFFDIDQICDIQSHLPHMLPSADFFAESMSNMGISNSDHVVIYDSVGLFTAPRVRWMLKCFGHQKISILRGGFPAWLAGGFITSAKITTPQKSNYIIENTFPLAANKSDIEWAINNKVCIIDARSSARFLGQVDEPREGVGRGHIPTSINIPFNDFIRKNQIKPRAELIHIFEKAGVDIKNPIIASCGSGVTAAIIDLALEIVECPDHKIYDGSWAEWGLIPH